MLARPPLHARADLLPPALAWWLVGEVPGAAPRPGPARSLEVTGPLPPDPSLPRLAFAPSASPFARTLTGADATPTCVLAALADATYAELHVPALASALDADAPYLALSPDPDGASAVIAASAPPSTAASAAASAAATRALLDELRRRLARGEPAARAVAALRAAAPAAPTDSTWARGLLVFR